MQTTEQQKRINSLQLPSMRVIKPDDNFDRPDSFDMDHLLYLELKEIGHIVANFYNQTLEEIKRRTRKREVVQTRQISMYFSRRMTAYGLSRIGAFFGGFDHATVLHACKTVGNLYDTDKKIRTSIDALSLKIEGALEGLSSSDPFSYSIDHESRVIHVSILSDKFTYNDYLRLSIDLASEEVSQKYKVHLY